MKKIMFFASFALCAMLVNAQTVQTKTLDLGDDVTVTYSYYLNDKGEEVYHGKMTVTEAPVNNPARKGKKSVTCNYQNNKITGSFTYSCNMQHFEKYIDKSKGIDYNVSTGNYEVKTMWKKVRDQKESFTVDLYENYLNGDFNISASARNADYQLLTIKGKANKGILVDGVNCELLQNGEIVESYSNLAPNFNDAKYIDYKAGQQYGARQYYNNTDGLVIEFGYTACRCSFTLKYPRYTKPYEVLEDIIAQKKNQLNTDDELYVLHEIQMLAHKKEIFLRAADSVRLEHMRDSIQNRLAHKKQIRDSLNTELQTVSSQYGKLKATLQEQINKNGTLKHRDYKIERSSYRDSYGMLRDKETIIPTFLPLDVDMLLFNKYNNLLTDLSTYLKNNIIEKKLALKPWSTNSPSNTEIKERIDIYSDGLQPFYSQEYIDFSNLISNKEILTQVIQKVDKIESYYTEQKTTATSPNNVARENTTIKVKNKKNLYNDYLAISSFLSARVKDASVDDYLESLMQFSKVCDKMIYAIDNNTKDIEKELKSTKIPEEKLNIFLKQ